MTFVAQHLDFWKDSARLNPHDALYILHWFDVKAFPSHSMSTNALEVILSSLVGALNNRPKLPHTIIIMLGDIKFWCDHQSLQFTMDSLLKVLIKEIKRIIQVRQRDLPVKAQSDDPRLFAVKLNWKPEKAVDSVAFYPKKRRTFNKLLDSVVRPRGVSTILLHEINDQWDPDLFLGHGELSQKGYRQVWSSLSKAIHDFDTIGHQKKKVYSVLNKFTAKPVEVESSIYSSDDDLITNQDADGHWDQGMRIQNRRRRRDKTGKPKNNSKWIYRHSDQRNNFF